MSEKHARDGTRATRCPKCGSARVMSDIRIGDLGHGNFSNDLSLELQERPEALIFKRTRRYAMKATVCGDCGFTEFYVTNPSELVKAHEAQRRRVP